MKHSSSRRTTLTLPSQCLELAERIAKKRHMNLSSVVGEALNRGLREEEQIQRSESVLESYKKAFAGFSSDELLLLDGILTEEPQPEKAAQGKRRVGSIKQRVRE